MLNPVVPEGWQLDVELLPSGLGRCIWSQRRIILDPRLTPGQRRCTLAHEILHARRGPFPAWQLAREEAIINAAVARTLIPLPALVDMLAWSQQPEDVAEALGVDLETLRLRVEMLTPSERSLLVASPGWDEPDVLAA